MRLAIGESGCDVDFLKGKEGVATLGTDRDESLPILRGYGSGRRGEDNERDAATRPLRWLCAG